MFDKQKMSIEEADCMVDGIRKTSEHETGVRILENTLKCFSSDKVVKMSRKLYPVHVFSINNVAAPKTRFMPEIDRLAVFFEQY